MTGLLKRDANSKPSDVFGRLDRVFGRLTKSPAFGRSRSSDDEWLTGIRIDEYRENGDLVIRAELPGIDPDKDVEVTVTDGALHIAAERREEEKVEKEGYLHHELRYGSFSRTLPAPEGVSEDDVKTSYKDGILEIRVPAAEPKPEAPSEIETTKD